jgi:hypothetical protein
MPLLGSLWPILTNSPLIIWFPAPLCADFVYAGSLFNRKVLGAIMAAFFPPKRRPPDEYLLVKDSRSPCSASAPACRIRSGETSRKLLNVGA